LSTPDLLNAIIENVERVIVGKRPAVEMAVVALLCEGHILVEDVPGIGKTTLCRAIARSIACSFRRIQLTPDVLPSDVTGLYFFNQRSCDFEFRAGPIFANLVLVDEVNRATPRTQSALLECMEERQVTVDGETHPLCRPFLVIATQNPVELEGTFPLPEAQLDRFLLKIEMGYPSEDEEVEMVLRFEEASPLERLQPVASTDSCSSCRRRPEPSTWIQPFEAMRCKWPGPPEPTRPCSWGPAPGPRWPSTGPRRLELSWRVAISSSPMT